MEQIGNGFKEYYYLTEEGQIYNAQSRKFLKGKGGSFKLRGSDNTSKYISAAALYELVYQKNPCNRKIFLGSELSHGVCQIL